MKRDRPNNQERERRKRRKKRLLDRRSDAEASVGGPPSKRVRQSDAEESLARARRFKPLHLEHTYTRISSPEVLSLVQNTEEVIRFGHRVRRALDEGHNVDLDMSAVVTIHPGAVALVLSLIARADGRGVLLKGVGPRNMDAARELVESGFYRFVTSHVARELPTSGSVFTRRATRVDPQIAASAIHQASEFSLGKRIRCQNIYTTLIECMNNTKQHAAGGDTDNQAVDGEPWWLAVRCCEATQVSSFAFIDVGIGVLKSLNLKLTQKLLNRTPLYPDTALLRDVLHGNIRSRTKLSYRGKGLPAIKQALDKGELSRLIVIANGVRADVGADSYETLTTPFAGTLVYWELHP